MKSIVLLSFTGLTFAIVAATTTATVRAAELNVTSPPTPPVIAPASSESAESLDGIRLPQGWTRSLFAAEPDVANVVAFDVDHQGRVFVCETFRQGRGVTDNRSHDDTWLLADLAAKTVQDRIDYHKRLLGDAAITYAQMDDRVRRLCDTDGDGRADESIVFADGFNHLEEGTGAGVLARGKNVYYTCIPKLWKLVDTNDDGKADERVALSDGYGVRVAFRGHDMHGLIIGPDGRLYFSIGDRGHYVTKADGTVISNPSSGSVFRCELDGTHLEVVASGLRNPQELAFNDVGDLFTGDNNSDSGDKARIVQVVPGGDSGWRMYYQYLSDRGPFNRESIWHPFHEEQPAYLVPPIANIGDGPSGFAFDPGTGVGSDARGKFFLCDFGGGTSNSGVRMFDLKPNGAFYALGSSDQPIWNVMATDVAFGPDGALWISDWVEGWEGVGKGRLYRLKGPDFDDLIASEVQEILASDMASHGVDRLCEMLGHADRRIRNEATWELARRVETAAMISVVTDANQSERSQLHAIWGIDQTVRHASYPTADSATTAAVSADQLNTILSVMTDASSDGSETIRAAAADYLGHHGDATSIESLRTRLVDESKRVVAHAAHAIAGIVARTGKASTVFADAVGLLTENDNHDPVLRHAGVMILVAAGDTAEIASLKDHANLSVRRAAVVALRRLGSDRVADFLDDASILVIQESARAIHDTPIAGAQLRLANQIKETSLTDEIVLRRILNANYRIGNQETAEALAAFAARPVAPMAMRLEAIDMLKDWASTDPRDRVLGDSRPLPSHEISHVVTGLAASLPSILQNPDEVRDVAVSVAASLSMREVTPFLEQRVTDRNLRPNTRAGALVSLSKLEPEKAVDVARSLLDATQVRLRIAALQTIASLDPDEAIGPLVKATQSDSIVERQAAWDELAKIDRPAAHAAISGGVETYLRGEVASDTALNLLEAAGPWLDKTLAVQLGEHQAAIASSDPLGKWLTSLDGGDSDAGKDVFVKTQLSCVRCHKIDRVGGEVGPVLTVIGKERDRRYLLESICLPDAAIAKGFETSVIADDSGQVFTGILRSENDDFVELITAEGAIVQIEQDAIVGRKRGKSAMPETLPDLMTPRELRDLVAYLASLKVDPRSADEKE